MRRWRWPLLLSAAVLLGQLLHHNPLVDVLRSAPPDGARLVYPFAHVVLAPFTLTADWLNGGSRFDLFGFLAWALLTWVSWRVAAPAGAWAGRPLAARAAREAVMGAGFVLAVVSFVGWVAYLPRPVPRLAVDGDLLVFDVHSHSASSHDGRPGFPPYVNADWHHLTGFDAAFLTDHNRATLARTWETFSPDSGPRALRGTELSLAGLHLLVLGTADSIATTPASGSWDSTLALIRRLAAAEADGGPHPLLVASLPEFWRNHWGADMGALIDAGVEGFEVWTSSPKAMEFPPSARATLIARAVAGGQALVGATDMHGLGWSASVWNVVALPGWRDLDDATLTTRLLAAVRARRHRVIAVDRWLPSTRLDRALAVPVNAALVLRGASRGHGLALLLWCWLPLAVWRWRMRAGR